MKLELASGHRPTRGYEHNDLYAWDHIEHVGQAWMLDLPNDSVEEVLALAFIEHLIHDHALDTLRNVHRMLSPGGMFLFDVPDYPIWAGYYLAHLHGSWAPVPMEHVRRTLFGWGRWPGDEHKFGWDAQLLTDTLKDCGFGHIEWGVGPFIARAHRQRFCAPMDAHLYVQATK